MSYASYLEDIRERSHLLVRDSNSIGRKFQSVERQLDKASAKLRNELSNLNQHVTSHRKVCQQMLDSVLEFVELATDPELEAEWQLRDELAKARKKLADAREENESLTKVLTGTEEELEDMESDLDIALEENRRLTSELSKRERLLGDLQDRLAKTEIALEENERLTLELDKRDKLVEGLQGRLSTLEGDFANVKEEKEELEEYLELFKDPNYLSPEMIKKHKPNW